MPNLIIDVRTPSEFAHSHIPNARNLPVLNDKQYQEIGTIYKHDKIRAKFLGASYACQNIARILENEAFSYEDEITLVCARGGMRSQSLLLVLQALGLRVSKKQGGYKQYRNEILEILKTPKKEDFITLCGPTGCGKSEIIQDASDFSLDLESLACHYGSSFGFMAQINLGAQPNQKMFENLIAHDFVNKKSCQPLLIEAESKRLGNLIVPKILAQSYHNAFKVRITSPMHLRVKRITELYGKIPQELFLQALEKIRPYMDRRFLNEVLALWEHRDLEKIAEILLTHYYDKVYKTSPFHLSFEQTDRMKTLEFFKNLRQELSAR